MAARQAVNPPLGKNYAKNQRIKQKRREFKEQEAGKAVQAVPSALYLFLQSLGLSRLCGVFEEHEIDMEALPLLTPVDFRDLGVIDPHTARILDAIACQAQRAEAVRSPRGGFGDQDEFGRRLGVVHQAFLQFGFIRSRGVTFFYHNQALLGATRPKKGDRVRFELGECGGRDIALRIALAAPDDYGPIPPPPISLAPPQQHHEAYPANRRTLVCRYYLRDACRNGEACNYIHPHYIHPRLEQPPPHHHQYQQQQRQPVPAAPRPVKTSFLEQSAKWSEVGPPLTAASLKKQEEAPPPTVDKKQQPKKSPPLRKTTFEEQCAKWSSADLALPKKTPSPPPQQEETVEEAAAAPSTAEEPTEAAAPPSPAPSPVRRSWGDEELLQDEIAAAAAATATTTTTPLSCSLTEAVDNPEGGHEEEEEEGASESSATTATTEGTVVDDTSDLTDDDEEGALLQTQGDENKTMTMTTTTTTTTTTVSLCRRWQAFGDCREGDTCRFVHAPESPRY